MNYLPAILLSVHEAIPASLVNKVIFSSPLYDKLIPVQFAPAPVRFNVKIYGQAPQLRKKTQAALRTAQ